MAEKRALIAIVNFDGKILLGKKKSSSHKFLAGKWHLPGETSNEEETDEEALIRGVKEEVGLNIRVGRYLASDITPTNKREARWYECFADTDKIVVGSDLEDAKFVTKEEVLKICSNQKNYSLFSLLPKEIIEYFQ